MVLPPLSLGIHPQAICAICAAPNGGIYMMMKYKELTEKL
jgi:hypothetical protein